MTKDARVVLNDLELNIPVAAVITKGTIKIGQHYALVRQQIFSAKGRCDLCENEKKAEGLIFVHDLQDDTIHISGKFCLKEVLAT